MYVFYAMLLAFMLALLKNKGFKKTYTYLKKIESLNIKGWYFVFIAALIRLSIQYLVFQKEIVDINTYENLIQSLNILSLGLCGLFLWLNMKHVKGIILLCLGYFLNLFVIIFNGGKMPVAIEYSHLFETSYMKDALIEGKAPFHALLTEYTKFPYLADVIPVVNPSLYTAMISIGDVLIIIGAFIIVYYFLTNK